MKKLLLGLGSIAAVIAPIAAVVSCGDDATTPAKTGEADQTPTTGGDAGQTQVTAPSGAVLAEGQYSNAAKEVRITSAQVIAGINALPVPTDKPALADLNTVTTEITTNWGNDWAKIQDNITTKQAKSHDYEKGGSIVEGGLGWMLFDNIDASTVTGATNDDGLFQFRTTALSKVDTTKSVAQVMIVVNAYKTYNDAHSSAIVKVGAALSGNTIDHNRDHQFNKEEIVAFLTHAKTLFAADAATLIDAAIANANTLTNF